LTGSHGSVGHWELKGKPLRFVLGLGVEIPGFCRLSDQGGKPRLRLETSSGALHLYRLAAAVLLMPPPFRELNRTTAEHSFWDGSYSITSFGIKVMSRENGVVNVETMELSSHLGLHISLDVIERLASVLALWEWSRSSEQPLALALQEHRRAVCVSPGDHKRILSSATRVLRFAADQKDPVDDLCAKVGIARFRIESDGLDDVCLHEISEVDDEDPYFSVNRLMRKARYILDRGPEGTKFRVSVREAYQDRCLATGLFLRASPGEWRSGVEAAHVYPFCQGGANSVNNGILLSPTAHWAFDQGFLRLSLDSSKEFYRWSWNDASFEKALETGCQLDRLDFAIGPIDPGWLPKQRSKRPKHAYLKALYGLLEGSQ